jgi:hypothetical protein
MAREILDSLNVFGDLDVSSDVTGAKFSVVGISASEVPLTIKGAPGQTAPSLEIVDSSDNVFLAVQPWGRLDVGQLNVSQSAAGSYGLAVTGAAEGTGDLLVATDFEFNELFKVSASGDTTSSSLTTPSILSPSGSPLDISVVSSLNNDGEVLSISSGDGSSDSASPSDGGNLVLSSGTGAGNGGTGGDINVVAGSGSGLATGGNVLISSGDAFSTGDISIVCPTGSNSGGQISITASGSSSGGINVASNTSDRLSFFGVSPTERPSATNDLKDSLVSLGLLLGGGATPLNLDGGVITANGSGITNLPISSIDASGTPSSSTFLRGDGNWATPGGSGDVTDEGMTLNYIPKFDGNGLVNSTIFIDGSSSIGIGTTSPYRKFHIKAGGLDGRLYFEGENPGDNPGLEFANDGSGTRRTLIRLQETGTDGTSLEFYVRPDVGGTVVNSMTLFHDTLQIVGQVSATTFSGNGALVTSLDASNLSSGEVPTARLGSGTANSSTFLRGDNTWQTISAGGLSNVVEDSTPQLGGNLDLNGNTVGDANQSDLTKLSEITATSSELNYVAGVTSNIQSQLDSKLGSIVQVKATAIETPTSGEDISLFYTTQSITISTIVAVLRGSSSPSVTWTIRHDPNRSATGIEVVSSGTTTTSTTNGDVVTTFNDATVPANSFVWLETTALSGTVNSLHVSIDYTVD